MPDYPPSVLAAATAAIRGQFRDDLDRPGAPEADALARAALEAAAPILAEAVAQKILAHMEEHDKATGWAARWTWRTHFGIAARVAAGAFYTREDQLRLAAEAIRRGEFIACDIPEVPGER
jgi:hypothetical protein